MNQPVAITKSDGTRQAFEEEKLIQSLKRAGAGQDAITEIVDHIEREIYDGIKTVDIYRHAFELLKTHSHHAAVKYSVRRALFELGPDGFPFEKFVARIFNAWGYEAVTDQTVFGSCVPHEVDVVAWKGEELIMVEAKFHNEVGMKSDLKVALYVKARFEDLAEPLYDYGGKKRKLTQGYLFTNTKFTDKAIHYGECKQLKMVGWNYPTVGNLQDIIEQYHLHPITSLTSLTRNQKRDLIGRGVLMCTDVVTKSGVLHEIGMNSDMMQRVVAEAGLVAASVSKKEHHEILSHV